MVSSVYLMGLLNKQQSDLPQLFMWIDTYKCKILFGGVVIISSIILNKKLDCEKIDASSKYREMAVVLRTYIYYRATPCYNKIV